MNILMFGIIFGVIFFILWLQNKTKTQQKVFGAGLISFGLITLLPPPDTDLFFVYPLFVYLKGLPANTTIQTLGNYFIQYEIFSAIVGLIIIFIGIVIAGYNPKQIWAKIKKVF